MKPSIKDVAKACNVSTTTVSLVLNDKPNRISEETKILIRKVAAEMNYRPNLLSRSLVTKKLGIIGLIVPNIGISFYSEFLQDLILNLETSNYNVLLGVSNFDTEKEKASVLRFLDYGVEAVILSGSYSSINQTTNESIQILANSKTPFLVVGGYAIGSPYNTISIDHAESGFLAAKHLLDLGHRKIGVLLEASAMTLNKLLLEGYKAALLEQGIEVDQDLIIDRADEEGRQYVLDYLLAKDVTCIIIGSSALAYRVFERARDIGINLPNDLSLISLGNAQSFDYLYPPLTYVAPPVKTIAQDMNGILHELMDKPKGYIDYHYKPELIVRKSTIPLLKRAVD